MHLPWKIVLGAAMPVALGLLLVLLLMYFCHHLGRRDLSVYVRTTINKFKHEGVLFSGLHRGIRDEHAQLWRIACHSKPFDWEENPAFIARAVEDGWMAFAFTHASFTSCTTAKTWSLCLGHMDSHALEPHISWQVGSDSCFTQRLCLNPGKGRASAAMQSLKTTLPLPGPQLGLHSFPSECYFEIIIAADGHGRESNAGISQGAFSDNEHVKLISHVSGKNMALEVKLNDDGKMQANGAERHYWKKQKNEGDPENPTCGARRIEYCDREHIVAVGLTAGSAPAFGLPGFYSGSVGLDSTGRVYLNGILQVSSLPVMKCSWNAINTTVGCGFDPVTKKVFFTVNGEHVCEIIATTIEFGGPLYPTVAANYEVTLISNFGQSLFEYTPANLSRTSDPRFRQPLTRLTKNVSLNDDSGDLFSMERADSLSYADFASPGSDNVALHNVLLEADSDLFEIALDFRDQPYE